MSWAELIVRATRWEIVVKPHGKWRRRYRAQAYGFLNEDGGEYSVTVHRKDGFWGGLFLARTPQEAERLARDQVCALIDQNTPVLRHEYPKDEVCP